MTERRACPACSADRPRTVVSLSARQIVSGNPTYRSGALQLLGIRDDDVFPIVSCAACDFVYAQRLPDDAFLRAVYDDVIDEAKARAESQSPSWTAHQLRLASLLVGQIAGEGVIRVLDYGCGYGVIVRALRTPAIHCIGYETGSGPLSFARAESLPVTGSLEEVRAAAPFDGIILSDVLEHVPDPRRLLAECRELLATHGLLAVSVPDFAPRRLTRVASAARAGEAVTPELNPWEHLSYFAPATLARMIESAGFTVRLDWGLLDFGLRAAQRGPRRWTNAARSAARMIGFSIRPHALATVQLAQKSR